MLYCQHGEIWLCFKWPLPIFSFTIISKNTLTVDIVITKYKRYSYNNTGVQIARWQQDTETSNKDNLHDNQEHETNSEA